MSTGLTKNEARRIAKGVRASEKIAGARGPGRRGASDFNVITAKITSNDGAAVASRKYAWSQQRKTSSGYEDAGITGTTTKRYAVAPNGEDVATGKIVNLVRIALKNGDATFGQCWIINNVIPDTDTSDPCTADDDATTVGGIPHTESADGTGYVPDGHGLIVYVVTGVVFNPTGDKKLYAFYRPLVFNSCGKLASVGAEVRDVVDTPDLDCTTD